MTTLLPGAFQRTTGGGSFLWSSAWYPSRRRALGAERHLSSRIYSSRNRAGVPDILNAPGLLPREGNTDGMPQVIQHMLPSWAPPELVKRISVTFLMLLLARIGHYIALPGLDLGVLAAATAGDGSVPQSLTSSLTGTASELGGNIYLLSITPYMTAGLTLAALQLIPEIKRHIELLREEGRSGRETINHYTNTLFVGAAFVQAITNASQLSFAAKSAGNFFKIQSIVTLMAGAVLCKFAVQNIDQHGLGDGTGIVIGAGIALSYSEYLSKAFQAFISAPLPPTINIAAAVLLCFASVVLVTWVQGMELRLPLSFFSARRTENTNQTRHPVVEKLSSSSIDMQSLFPLRLSPSGTRQLLFANFWASLLDAPLSAIGFPGLLNNPFMFAAVVFIFEALSFADATPKQIASFLAQNDAVIVGLSPGDATKSFLRRRKAQLKFNNAAFIASISLVSRLIDMICFALIGVAPGMLNLLLLVSTILGGARQVQALAAGNSVEATLECESKKLEIIARHGFYPRAT